MTRVDIVSESALHARAEKLVFETCGGDAKILKNALGKPYVGGNPIYISLSHSRGVGVVATDKKPVGVDLETARNRIHTSISRRFSQREQGEITSERDFLKHWTAREAFLKMRGGTLARDLLKTEYFGGRIYYNGDEQECLVRHFFLENNRVLTICTEEKQ